MSRLTIQERFSIDAPPDDVWSFLVDPSRVVTCLPGAELTAQTDEKTYDGAVKVKIGAVTVAYRGTAVFEERDADAYYVRIVGRGREKSGSGTVSMTMESRVEASPDGGASVSVDAEIKLAGKIVRFGRGMIQTVSAEIFHEFTRCMEQRVVADSKAGAHGDSSGATVPGEEPPAGETPEAREAPPGDHAASASATSSPDLALLPLLWRALKRWVGGLFRRP
jgi:uncharacterized protein